MLKGIMETFITEAKSNLEKFGHLEKILLTQTDRGTLIGSLHWTTEEEKRKVLSQCINTYSKMGCQLFVLVGEASAKKIDIATGETGVQDQILITGATREGHSIAVMVPFSKTPNQLHFEEPMWIDKFQTVTPGLHDFMLQIFDLESNKPSQKKKKKKKKQKKNSNIIDNKNCQVCGTSLPSNDKPCPRCGAQFFSYDDMDKFIEKSLPRKEEKVPLKVWGNKKFEFKLDKEVYDDPDQFTTEVTKRFERKEYWYVLKFLFMDTVFYNANPQKDAKIVGGIPTDLKIRCNCGKTLEDFMWLEGIYTIPEVYQQMLKRERHEYYLRFSQRCDSCDLDFIVYRPKIQVFEALHTFINSLLPEKDFDLLKSRAVYNLWLSIIDRAIEKNPEEIVPLYHEDIKKFWDLREIHPEFNEEWLMKMNDTFNFDSIIDYYKNIFNHRIKKLLQFIGRSLMIIHKHPPVENLDKILPIYETATGLTTVIGHILYKNENKAWIYSPLYRLENQLEGLEIPGYERDIFMFNNIVWDFFNVLKECEVEDTGDLPPEGLHINKEDATRRLFMWHLGGYISTLLEFNHHKKIPLNGKIISILEKMYEALGKQVYAGEPLPDITPWINDLKIELKKPQDPIYRKILEDIEKVCSSWTETLSKTPA